MRIWVVIEEYLFIKYVINSFNWRSHPPLILTGSNWHESSWHGLNSQKILGAGFAVTLQEIMSVAFSKWKSLRFILISGAPWKKRERHSNCNHMQIRTTKKIKNCHVYRKLPENREILSPNGVSFLYSVIVYFKHSQMRTIFLVFYHFFCLYYFW